MSKLKTQSNVTIATNRKANFNYDIKTTLEVGVVLKGAEVKSIRNFGMSVNESYVKIYNNECYLVNSHIKEMPAFEPYQAKRDRKLLMHKKEIINFKNKLKTASYTIIPLLVYFKESLIKVRIGLAIGKKLFDKRRAIKEKEWKKDKLRIYRNMSKT